MFHIKKSVALATILGFHGILAMKPRSHLSPRLLVDREGVVAKIETAFSNAEDHKEHFKPSTWTSEQMRTIVNRVTDMYLKVDSVEGDALVGKLLAEMRYTNKGLDFKFVVSDVYDELGQFTSRLQEKGWIDEDAEGMIHNALFFTSANWILEQSNGNYQKRELKLFAREDGKQFTSSMNLQISLITQVMAHVCGEQNKIRETVTGSLTGEFEEDKYSKFEHVFMNTMYRFYCCEEPLRFNNIVMTEWHGFCTTLLIAFEKLNRKYGGDAVGSHAFDNYDTIPTDKTSEVLLRDMFFMWFSCESGINMFRCRHKTVQELENECARFMTLLNDKDPKLATYCVQQYSDRLGSMAAAVKMQLNVHQDLQQMIEMYQCEYCEGAGCDECKNSGCNQGVLSI